MVGLESIERNVEVEDAATKRQADADHAAIYPGSETGNDPPPTSESGEVGNKYMVAGNMTVNHPQAPASAVAAVQAPPPAKKSKLWPALLVGMSLLAGAGIGAVAYDYLNPSKDTDTDTITEFDFPPQSGG